MRRMPIICAACLLLTTALAWGAGLAAASTITSGALFGDQSVESVHDSEPAGQAKAFPFTATFSGTAQSITVYVGGATTLNAALYSDHFGKPGALLASGSATATAAGWTTATIANKSITQGTTYWVALLGNSSLTYRDGAQSGCVSVNTPLSRNITRFPASFPQGLTYQSCPLSAYASGTTTLPPPTARFTFSPNSPVAGSAVKFDGSSSTCAETPCSYSWAGDGGPNGQNLNEWPLGTGDAFSYTFSDAGPKYVRLTLTDAQNRTATVEHDVVVSAPPSAAPVAPSNTALPTISGTAQQGFTLTASPGTWSGDTPMTYSYQWSDGTTGETDTLMSADVGQRVSVKVTASNDAGTAGATSASVGPITAPPPPPSGTDCAGTPGSATPNFASMDACSFPSPDTTGPPAGTQLTSSGTITASTPGETISNVKISGGGINVEADNVTIKDSVITSGNGTLGANWAIYIAEGVTGTKVLYTTLQGGDCQGRSLLAGVWNTSGDLLTMDHDYGNCVDDILHGAGTLTNSYSIDNANIPNDHYEPVAYDGGSGGITINHDTLLNAHDQTAAVFVTCNASGGQAPVTSETVTNSLMAGGDYVVYGPNGNGTCDSRTPGSAQTFTGNRISRLYYPTGGYYGPYVYFSPGATISRNVWDDTNQAIP